MFLVLSRQDLARLSPALRAELQQLVFNRPEASYEEIDFPDWGGNESADPEFDPPHAAPWPDSSDKAGDSKRVIDINVDEARALVGNLSAKSIQTLRRFASDESVAFDSLVGPGNAYESLSDLKRSFVGAVNRRLRTVTRNRSAVLFRKVEGDAGLSITVRPMTAAALKQVMPTGSSEDS